MVRDWFMLPVNPHMVGKEWGVVRCAFLRPQGEPRLVEYSRVWAPDGARKWWMGQVVPGLQPICIVEQKRTRVKLKLYITDEGKRKAGLSEIIQFLDCTSRQLQGLLRSLVSLLCACVCARVMTN